MIQMYKKFMTREALKLYCCWKYEC